MSALSRVTSLRMHWTNTRPEAADPQIFIAVEEEWTRRDLPFGVRNLAMAALSFPMDVLHAVRACAEKQPAAPLHGVLGWKVLLGCEQAQLPLVHASFHSRDLGEALWNHWRQVCAKAQTLLQFLLIEFHSDGALAAGDFNLNTERIMFLSRTRSATPIPLCWKPDT